MLATFAVGCGDDGGAPQDAMVDAPRVCATESAKTFDLSDFGTDFASYYALLDTQLDGHNVYYEFQFFGGIESSLAGTWDLRQGNQANYKNCAVCVLAYEYAVDPATMKITYFKTFFQSAGSVTLNSDPLTSKQLSATVTGLELQEVTIDKNMGYLSIPVLGGVCTTVADNTIEHDQVPNAWTCTPRTDFGAGTDCNCACGAPDPDCENAAATITGCPNTFDKCLTTGTDAGKCTTPPPANDACANAVVLGINATATAGRTVGAAADYNGADGVTCTATNVAQPGADVAYKVTLTATVAYTIKLTNLSTTFDGSLALLGPGTDADCGATPIANCAAGADTNGAAGDETIIITPTTTGDYFILVDSKDSSTGTFNIQVTSP